MAEARAVWTGKTTQFEVCIRIVSIENPVESDRRSLWGGGDVAPCLMVQM